MKRKRLLVAVCALAVAAGGWVAANRPVTHADLRAVGSNGDFEVPPYPAWVPAWLADRLPERAARAVAVSADEGGWHPEADAVIARLPPVTFFELSGGGLTDASLRRLLDRHPVDWLLAHDTALTAGGVRAAAEVLQRNDGHLYADVAGASDEELISMAADFPGGVLDETIARRLARSFCGGHLDDADEDFVAHELRGWSGAAVEGPNGRLRRGRRRDPGDRGSRFSSVVRDRDAPGDSAELSLEFNPASPGDRATLTPRQSRLLASLRAPDEVRLAGVDADLRPVPAWRHLEATNATPRVVPALERVGYASLGDWRFGDGPLVGLRMAAGTGLSVSAAEGCPLNGSFLKTAALPKPMTLAVRGEAGAAPPRAFRVGEGVGPPASLHLRGVSLDGPSLRRLCGAVTAWLVLERLPCVSAADVTAALRAARPSYLYLGVGVPLEANGLRAALTARTDGPEFPSSIDERSLPPPGVVAAVVAALPAEGVRETTVVTGERPSAAARELLKHPAVERKLRRGD